MSRPSGEEIARHYETAHRRVSELALTLTPEQAVTPCPGTPGWSVRDVLAHLAALPSDILAGRLTGIPDDTFTAAQVDQRRQRELADVIGEWTEGLEPLLELVRAGLVPPNLAVDALTHEQDIRGALGLAPALRQDELRFVVGQYAFGCGHRLRQAGIPAVRLSAADSDFTTVAGAGEPQASLEAPEFELFRALSGRRSRRQIASYTWTGDPDAYLAHLNIFGAVPEIDVTDLPPR